MTVEQNGEGEKTAVGTAGRIEHWTQKLLDFSARNRLLNIPQKSRQVVHLACDDIATLEDMLADGKGVSVRSSEEKKKDRVLYADLPPDEVKRRMVSLMRDARRNLEESGVNTLFLALGTLQWLEPGRGANRKAYRAPILLVPVRLERASMAEGVKMSALDEDISVNVTLVEFLRSQCGVTVEGVDPLPLDEHGVDVAKVLESFRAAIAGQEGWDVFPEAVLGCFSFGKFVMWKDMTARADELVKHPLVDHRVGGGGLFDDGVEVFPPEEIAAHANPAERYCPVTADSAQLTAVLYPALGKTVVLHGPPGTGKSQTITNIIAHNLAKGRRVLFVSEKKAALDVVKDRLEKIGLMPFCLELHSNKTEKSHFYAQIKAALDVPETASPGEWNQTVADLERYRGELDGYVRALHRVQYNGLTAYDCFVSRMAGGPAAVKVDAKALALSAQDVATLRENVAKLGTDWRATSEEAVSALEPVADFEWNPVAERETGEAIERLAAAIRLNGFAYVRKVGETLHPLDAAEMRAAAEGAEKLASRPGFLRGVFAFFAGIGKRKVEGPFAESLDRARAAIGESRGVIRYRETRSAVCGKIGTALADAVENGLCKPERTVEEFDRAFAEKTLDEILASTPELASFAGLAQDERVALYRQLDGRQTELARKMVFAKLAESLPRRRSGPCPEGTELGMIKRECEKKSRQKAVRTMLKESRTLLPTLKPCFLMSPLSVAQYLPVDAPPFDLVVFDEASQIPVWDAIGVIARGKQLIVVGDPKQMPPTSFFQKGDVEDEDDEPDEEMIADQESILDECLVAGVAATYLNWHYRSRHESLITFSNEHYYENRLFTFPAAADSPRLGVKFMFVPDGRFEKTGSGAGSRVNRVEAQALVDYVCGEMKKPGYKPRRVGIVTFSISQQRLIQTLLDERRAADRKLEERLPEDGPDAYFVKNLENVQGDESNVILFSVGYAPDENGRFTMNFGPLNLTGGERRLNVAVTRAKEQVVVFSSIHGSQIDLERTKAVGASHLKAFLDYAEKGGGVAQAAAGAASGEAFGDVVAAFLREKGYEVDRDVGCSNYRIDVAVRDPADPKRHLLGIECDGPAYAGQRTAHDREVNRTGVLKGLGWHMCRVWSMDWAYDRARAEERLLERIDMARKGIDEPEPKLPARRVEDNAPQTAAGTAAPHGAPAGRDGVPPPSASAVPVTHGPYKVWKTSARYQSASMKDDAAIGKIKRQMEEIIKVEGPIYESVLFRRVCKVWNVVRMTESVTQRLLASRPSIGFVTKHGDARVFWAPGQKPETWRAYREPGADEASRRSIDEIPPEELANAMRGIVDDLGGSCPQDALYRETVKVFGIASVTPKAREYLDMAYALTGQGA